MAEHIVKFDTASEPVLVSTGTLIVEDIGALTPAEQGPQAGA